MECKIVYRELLRFGIVGTLATALHYGVYLLLQRLIDINIAYTVGYLISFIANFYATSYFTFDASPSWKELFGMGAAHGVNYVLHIALLNLFLWLGAPSIWAPFPVFAIAFIVNFLLVRFYLQT